MLLTVIDSGTELTDIKFAEIYRFASKINQTNNYTTMTLNTRNIPRQVRTGMRFLEKPILDPFPLTFGVLARVKLE